MKQCCLTCVSVSLTLSLPLMTPRVSSESSLDLGPHLTS